MCGIAGYVSLTGAESIGRPALQRMTESLRHRGPDGHGFYAWPEREPVVGLGVRRLAILDLETGDQPFVNEDGTAAVVANGEIYNYRDLRRELVQRGHRFRSSGDIEVLVHLYEEHGLDMFDRLRGMYAVALWDAPRARLVLAVDQIGIKPLYLLRTASALFFASEVKAFSAAGVARLEPRLAAIDTYLSFGYAITEDTLFDGVERLAPASALIVERGACSTRRLTWPFVTVNGGEGRARTSTKPESPVRHALGDAVRSHLQSDVPVGLCLSGGVDSVGLLALMRHEAGTVNTYTVAYDEGGAESAEAARAATWAGARHTELRLTPGAWWDALAASVVAQDEPVANPSMVSLLALSRVAAQNVRVVLNGTGGDELFGGYPGHARFPALLRLHASSDGTPTWRGLARGIGRMEPGFPFMRRWPIVARLPARLAWHRARLDTADGGLRRLASFEHLVLGDYLRCRLYRPELLADGSIAGHSAGAYRRLFDEVVGEGRPDEPAEDLAQRLIARTWLPGNGLLTIDKLAMAHSLEARVPYLDRPLIECLMSLPPAVRLRPGKALLRAALAGDVPDELRLRRKQPFETPIARWLESTLSPSVQAVLLDPAARIREVFEPAEIERLVRRHGRRVADHAELIYRLLVLELWWKLVLTP